MSKKRQSGSSRRPEPSDRLTRAQSRQPREVLTPPGADDAQSQEDQVHQRSRPSGTERQEDTRAGDQREQGLSHHPCHHEHQTPHRGPPTGTANTPGRPTSALPFHSYLATVEEVLDEEEDYPRAAPVDSEPPSDTTAGAADDKREAPRAGPTRVDPVDPQASEEV